MMGPKPRITPEKEGQLMAVFRRRDEIEAEIKRLESKKRELKEQRKRMTDYDIAAKFHIDRRTVQRYLERYR